MKKWSYYNDSDPKACEWARELIKRKLVPDGEVDCRSISEIQPDDLTGFIQCHFFSGILGWSLALQLAGWPIDRPVWTGSCPCQPFSVAGKGKGNDDDRHLWPVFRELIRERRPPVVFGEQVASKAGREWLAGVFFDLESMAYRRAGADLCAAGVGSPHIRQRLNWVADTSSSRAWRHTGTTHCEEASSSRQGQPDGLQNMHVPSAGGSICGLVHPIGTGLEGHAGHGHNGHQPGRQQAQSDGPTPPAGGAWDSFDWLPCTDGKTRRIESGTFPLAHGVSGRVGLLRGYGNAIVPQVSAEFIKAYQETKGSN